MSIKNYVLSAVLVALTPILSHAAWVDIGLGVGGDPYPTAIGKINTAFTDVYSWSLEGISHATSDGNTYGSKNNAWVQLNVSNWDVAYGWGNHALPGYLTSFTENDPVFTAWDKDYADLINKPTIPTISDIAYDGTSWNGNTDGASKNAIRDKIESLAGGHDAVTLGTANGMSLATQVLSLAASTASTPGAATAVQITKLDGIATGATLNSTDATLLARANHTGSQVASTISDFDTEVSNNVSVTANTAKVSVPSGTENQIIQHSGSAWAASSTLSGLTSINFSAPSAYKVGASAWAASTTVVGPAELAITSEVDTGSDVTRAITPDALAGAYAGTKEAAWHIYDSDTDTVVGDSKQGFPIPDSFAGMDLIDVTCRVVDLNSATGGTTTVVIRRLRGATAVDMTSTGVTIAYNEYYASDEVIATANDDVQIGDMIYPDINAVTTGAVHKGLGCTALFRLP